MAERLVKRYPSRKLYDTAASSYVSLAGLAKIVRAGERVRVIEGDEQTDVTVQVLGQVITEEARRGRPAPSANELHAALRGSGGSRSSVEQLKDGVGRLVRRSVDRIPPLRRMRGEMDALRGKLEELEGTLRDLSVDEETKRE